MTWVVGSLARHWERCGHAVLFLHPGTAPGVRAKRTALGFRGYELRMRLPFSADHPLRSLAAFAGSLPLTLYRLARVLRSHHIDVVNVHYPLDGFVHLALCRLFVPVKLVVSVHGSDLFPLGEPPPTYSLALRFLLRVTDLIVAPSKAFAERVAGSFPESKGRLIWIHNGIAADNWAPPPTGSDRSGSAVSYILCVAWLYEVKNIDVLLEAFARLETSQQQLRLVLIGDGPLRGELERLATHLGVRERVEFTGAQDQPVIRRFLQGCSVFVLPSRSESFGLAALEAMACGKPVVASRVGGIPEIIEDGQNGLLVQPGDPDALCDAISRVLKDEDLRRSLGENARLTAERFTTETMVAGYEHEFRALLE